MTLESITALREVYAEPKGRAVSKQLDSLDRHCIHFIELSPFVVLATTGASGAMDASPRGGAPGFVRVLDAQTLLLPDAPGNNRLDSLSNIIETGRIGLLFLVPGIDETLRINGQAALTTDAGDLASCADERRTPKAAIRITVREAYLHCAKALMRSRLWSDQSRVERGVLPSMGKILNDQTGARTPPETQEEMLRRYAADL
jgi:PPOX class probable FMN-dependent enzyme